MLFPHSIGIRVNRRSKRGERDSKRVGAIGLVALSMRQSVSPVLSTPDADRRSSHREPLNRTPGLGGAWRSGVGEASARLEQSSSGAVASIRGIAGSLRWLDERALCEIYFTRMLVSHVVQSKGNQPLTGSKSVQIAKKIQV